MDIEIIASSSKGNAVYIKDEETALLLDCGISFSWLHQWFLSRDLKVSDLEGVLISHEHKDHCKAVKDVIKYGVNCYMSLDTEKSLGLKKTHRIKRAKAGQLMYIGTWTILPFEAVHDVYCLGYLLQSKYGHKLVYLTDSSYCKEVFKNPNYILLAVNYVDDIAMKNNKKKYKRIINSHMNLDTAIEFIKKNTSEDLKQINLLHLSDDNAHEKKIVREIKKAAGKTTKVIA